MYTSLEINDALRAIYKADQGLLDWILIQKGSIDFDSLLITVAPPVSKRRFIVPFSYFAAPKCFPGYIFSADEMSSLRCFVEFFINKPCVDNVEIIKGVLQKARSGYGGYYTVSPGTSEEDVIKAVDETKKRDAMHNNIKTGNGGRIPIITFIADEAAFNAQAANAHAAFNAQAVNAQAVYGVDTTTQNDGYFFTTNANQWGGVVAANDIAWPVGENNGR